MSAVPLDERLDKIKSPKLQNQRETAVVLSAVEETLKDQKHEFTPTAYFVALLALLGQTVSTGKGLTNKELATSVLYLLDVVTSYVPAPLLRAKFSQVFAGIDSALRQDEAEAPMLRSCIGCIESLLIAQDSTAWALPQTQAGPRLGVARLLDLSLDHRPKVRKRALDALQHILQHPPPSPALDHPAADLCAATALDRLEKYGRAAPKSNGVAGGGEHSPNIIHALQLIKAVSQASGGWPSRYIDTLCEALLDVAKSSNQYLTMASYDLFDVVLTAIAEGASSAKLPRLLEVLEKSHPSQNDAQLLPPWIAILARAYEVSAQVEPEQTFLKLPDVFGAVSGFLTSMSYNIRSSTSECLISLVSTCIPPSVILEPSVYDEKTLEKLSKVVLDLVSVKYQLAWKETFTVLAALFDSLKWRAVPYLNEVVLSVGNLRGNESFSGKKEADAVLAKVTDAIGPDNLLDILPLNLANQSKGQPGRAWLLPILRDNITNTHISHFKSEFIPLSEALAKRVVLLGKEGKTMETKIFETLISQIWSLLPGYFTLPLDLRQAFDQDTAQMVSTKLYEMPDLRVDLCKALHTLVDCNKEIAALGDEEEDLLEQRRISIVEARANIEHLAGFASSFLGILFNIYSATLPHLRGYILQCINGFLGIIPTTELETAFSEVVKQLEAELTKEGPQTQADKQAAGPSSKMPPTSHALMDLVIAMAAYLPSTSFHTLLRISQAILPRTSDPQLQKKAYKLIPRLASSEVGTEILKLQNQELQSILLSCASSTAVASRRDRLTTLFVLVNHMPSDSLHFIPAILSDVLVSAKEINEKTRLAAFDLLVLMGQKMAEGGTIDRSKIPNMDANAGTVSANLEEYFTMLSAGLGGMTPLMISASVAALARVLHEFHSQLSSELLEKLTKDMATLLTSSNREVVRAVLGYHKVAILELPKEMIRANMPEIVSGLLQWSHDHKGPLRVKVKAIFERLLRRFGFDLVSEHCPEADRKLLINIRKRKERTKRKKAEGPAATHANGPKRAGAFASELDEALAESDDDASSADSHASGSDDGQDSQVDSSDDETTRANGRSTNRQPSTYIMEDADEPLDLLDRKALGRISSSKPVRFPERPEKRKAKTNADGKLMFGVEEDDDGGMELDAAQEQGGGVSAYVEATSGRDAVQRGRGGKLKFNTRRDRRGGGGGGGDGGVRGVESGDADQMDLDDQGGQQIKQQVGKWAARKSQQSPKKGVPPRRGLGERKAGDAAGSPNGVKRGRIVKQRGRGGRGMVQRGRRGKR